MKIREYCISTAKKNIDLSVCLVSDLHSMRFDDCISAVKRAGADIVVCAGDMLERLDGKKDDINECGLRFLESVSQISPTFYTFGNHERFGSHKEMRVDPVGAEYITDENLKKIQSTGVVLLNDDLYRLADNVIIGGILPANENPSEAPNLDFVREFASLDGFKILICHRPEYYDEYLREHDIDLILAGHTHGGQWRLFGCGVYAPNQGLFPKFSSGIYDNRLIVSAGASNTQRPIPRFFNPREISIIKIKSI